MTSINWAVVCWYRNGKFVGKECRSVEEAARIAEELYTSSSCSATGDAYTGVSVLENGRRIIDYGMRDRLGEEPETPPVTIIIEDVAAPTIPWR